NIAGKLNAIQKENVTLLLKTQQKLLKIKSLIQQYLRMIDNIPQSTRGASEALQLLKELMKTFNAVTQKLQTIGRLTSGEIVSNVDTKDTFPEVEIKDSTWTQVPHSRVMPDKFVVLTMRNGIYRHIQATEAVPPGIAVGIHPSMMENGAFTYDE